MTSAATVGAVECNNQKAVSSVSSPPSPRLSRALGRESPSSTSLAPRTVGFDTFDVPNTSANNEYEFSGVTLKYRHPEFNYSRLSRISLVAVDTDEYSEAALQYFLEELVQDGDEIVCLRAVDPKVAADDDFGSNYTYGGGTNEMLHHSQNNGSSNSLPHDCPDLHVAPVGSSGSSSLRTSYSSTTARDQPAKRYREEAQRFLNAIVDKNTKNKRVSITLEFAVGGVYGLIRRMIDIYQPCVLVLGTRGRPVEGFRGLLPGSVSKHCLQHSPIPVIIVRPEQKRAEIRSRRRRALDPSKRASYRRVLLDSLVNDHVTLISDGATGRKLPPRLPEHLLTPTPLTGQNNEFLLPPSSSADRARSQSPSQTRSRPHTPLGRLFKFSSMWDP